MRTFSMFNRGTVAYIELGALGPRRLRTGAIRLEARHALVSRYTRKGSISIDARGRFGRSASHPRSIATRVALGGLCCWEGSGPSQVNSRTRRASSRSRTTTKGGSPPTATPWARNCRARVPCVSKITVMVIGNAYCRWWKLKSPGSRRPRLRRLQAARGPGVPQPPTSVGASPCKSILPC